MNSITERLSGTGLAWVGAIALINGALLIALTTSSVAGWFATALILLGVWGIKAQGKLPDSIVERVPERWWKRADAALPFVVTALVVAWVTWPAAIGVVPVSQDHAHHYLQTSILTDDLLANGHVFGWTERIGAGLPFGDVYATGVYFVTGFLRIVTFGLVSRATSYALGLYVVWLVPTWAVVAWTRRLLAGVTDRQSLLQLGAIAAGTLAAIDIGADREGGWVYSMFHAVWPQLFATGLWLWGALAMVRLVERPTTRRLGVAVLVTGFAFWAHPMNAFNLLVTAPILFVAVLVAARGRTEDDPNLDANAWWLVPAFGLAAVIGFAWLSRLMGARDLMASYTAYGESLERYAELFLASGTPFAGTMAVTAMLAALGFVIAAGRGGVARTFTILAFVGFLCLTSVDLLASSDFGLSNYAPFIMFKRFAMTAKPLMFALAGVGLVAALQIARENVRVGSWGIALSLIASSPFVFAAFDALPGVVRAPSARFLTAADAEVEKSLGSVISTIEDELDATPGPKRVMVWHGRGDQGDYALFAVAELGVGYLPNRVPPAQALSKFTLVRDIDSASFYGASHIISRSDRTFRGAKLVGDFPPYKLWRINNMVGDGVRWFGASAQVETVEWSPMRHVVEVKNNKGKGNLAFAIPPHPKWHFSQNGVPLETEEFRLEGGALATRVLGLTDGTVVAEFKDTTTENVAFALMLVLLILSIVGLVWNRELPTFPTKWTERAAIPVIVAAVLGLAIALLVARALGAAALDDVWAKPSETVLEALHRQQPHVDYEPKPFCVRPYSRNPRVGCDDTQLEPRLRLSASRGDKIPACLEVDVPDGGHLDLTFALPEGTTRVAGRFEKMRGVVPRLLVDGKTRPLAATFDQKPTGRVFSLRLDNGSRRVQTACLEIVAIGR